MKMMLKYSEYIVITGSNTQSNILHMCVCVLNCAYKQKKIFVPEEKKNKKRK